MLNPDQDRLYYGEQLSAPEGYRFDSAIATTFSLDLDALLAVPFALCFDDNLDGNLKNEKLATLEAIGQLKGRLKVFYQKGNIHLSATFNHLYTLLEPCLEPVIPEGGAFSSFHPKLWLLRYCSTSPATKAAKVCYRLIVLSRNLTLDRSWDIAVTLDGTLQRSKQAINSDDYGIEFLKDLLKRDKGFSPAEDMLKELDRIEWVAPSPFKKTCRFLAGGPSYGTPLSIDGKPYDEILVVSPFLRSAGGGIDGLNNLATLSPNSSKEQKILMSTARELNAIGLEALDGWTCYSLNELVVSGEELHQLSDGTPEGSPKTQELHAKLILLRNGNKVFLHVGSANVTAAALGKNFEENPRNTETMLLLEGNATKVGPDILLNQFTKAERGNLFVPHEFQTPKSVEDQKLKDDLRRVVHELISASWVLKAALDESGDLFSLQLTVKTMPQLGKRISVQVGQLSVSGWRKFAPLMEWHKVALVDISSFIPVTIKIANTEIEKKLVIEAKLEIEGGDQRSEAILKEIVDSPQKVLSYLRLLIQTDGPNRGASPRKKPIPGDGGGDIVFSEVSVLEELLIASSRNPYALERISSVLKSFRKAKIQVPESFMKLWKYFQKETP